MTSDRATTLVDLASAADALTDPVRHVEKLEAWDRNRHRVRKIRIITLPSLLDQLAAAVVPGEAYSFDDEPTRSSPRSIPPAQLDAIDRLLAIEAGAALWCRRWHLPLRDAVASNIRALVGGSGTADSDATAELLSDLLRWKNWALTVTGWLRPALTPRAPCPLCEKRSLRIRLDRSTACCLACGEGWDANTIGLLAEHIKLYGRIAQADADVAKLRAKQAEQLRRERMPA